MAIANYLQTPINWIKSTLPISIPIKIVIGIFFTIIGGSGLLGILSEFATYSYALSFGFRPPVEGVPYLKASITLISFFLFMGSIIVFALIYLLIKSSVLFFDAWLSAKINIKQFKLIFTKKNVNLIREKSFKYSLVVSLAGGLAVATLLVFISFKNKSLPFNNIELFTFISIVVFFFYLGVFQPWIIKIIAGLWVLVFVIALTASMFITEYYTKFMQISGFGGGTEINVVHTNNDEKCKSTQTIGGLLLRTNDYLILSKEKSKEVLEIPVKDIKQITYLNTGKIIYPDKTQ